MLVSARFPKRLRATNDGVVGHGFRHFHGLVKLVRSVHRRRGVAHQTVAVLGLRLPPEKRRRLFAVNLFNLLYYLLYAQHWVLDRIAYFVVCHDVIVGLLFGREVIVVIIVIISVLLGRHGHLDWYIARNVIIRRVAVPELFIGDLWRRILFSFRFVDEVIDRLVRIHFVRSVLVQIDSSDNRIRFVVIIILCENVGNGWYGQFAIW